MTTHSNILAWKIPCTEEPDVLQSWGGKSQTQLSTHTQCLNRQMCRENVKCLFLGVNILLGTSFLYLYFKVLLL